MKTTFCQPIDIDINPLINDIKDYGTAPHQVVQSSSINPKLQNFLAFVGLRISWVEIFYNDPFQISQIHTDDQHGDYSKLNFIFGGAKSNMCWYTPKKEFENRQASNTSIQTKSIKYDYKEVILIHKEQIVFPSIVQVGIPHNIVNNWQQRWCVSFVLNFQRHERASFQAACEKLNNFLL